MTTAIIVAAVFFVGGCLVCFAFGVISLAGAWHEWEDELQLDEPLTFPDSWVGPYDQERHVA